MPNTWAFDIETTIGATQSVKNLRERGSKEIVKIIEADKLLPKERKNERKVLDQRYVDRNLIEADAAAKIAKASELDRAADALNPLTATPICVVCIPMNNIGLDHAQAFTDSEKFYSWAKEEVGQFLGFNIDQFDIPCLRLYQARITSGIVPRIPAFWNHSIDLRKEFGDVYNKGEVYSTPRNLQYYVATILDQEAQRPGPVKEYLESDFTGADVAAAYVDWGEGGKDKILRHCILDALMPALIAVKMGIYR